MALYRVILRNLERPEISSVVEISAASSSQAGEVASRHGFRVTTVREISSTKKATGPKRAVSKKELIKLFRGLASMLKANISTADALSYYAQGLPDASLQTTLLNIRERLEAGMPVHVAFAKEKRFEETIITIIEAGADAGQLHEAFQALARRIKVEMTFSSKIRSALLLPCLVILFQIGLLIWSQTSVVSEVEKTLQSVRQEPDPLSKVIFSFSHVVQLVWPVFVAALLAFIIALFRSRKFRRQLLETLMHRWSLLRQLVMGLRQTAYIGTLQMLYANGINLPRASALSAKTIEGTPQYAGLLKASQLYESSGIPFAEALKRSASLDPQVIHMISIGEKSASLSQQLELLRDIYEEDTAAYMTDFTQVINFLTLLMAVCLIALVFAGSMLPIFLMGPRMMNSGSL
jgi:type II secretory pathway component PulF